MAPDEREDMAPVNNDGADYLTVATFHVDDGQEGIVNHLLSRPTNQTLLQAYNLIIIEPGVGLPSSSFQGIRKTLSEAGT